MGDWDLDLGLTIYFFIKKVNVVSFIIVSWLDNGILKLENKNERRAKVYVFVLLSFISFKDH